MRHLLGYGNRTGVAYFALNLWIDGNRGVTYFYKNKKSIKKSVEVVFVVGRFIDSAIIRFRARNALMCTIQSQ